MLLLVPQLVRETPKVAPAPPQSPVAPPRADVEMTPVKRLRWRLGEALRQPDQARLLRSLAAADELGCTKRRLQQNQSRLPAARLNPAIDRMVGAGLIAREGGTWLMLSIEVREALRAVEIDVSRAKKARARWRAKTRKTNERTEGQTSTRKRTYCPRRIPDRRHNPHAWGRSRLARRGGLAVQKEYRWLGLHPTAPATAAGQAKRDEQKRRQVPYTAPVTFSDVQPTPGVAYSATGATGGAISAALRFNEPIGRSDRLAADRNRR